MHRCEVDFDAVTCLFVCLAPPLRSCGAVCGEKRAHRLRGGTGGNYKHAFTSCASCVRPGKLTAHDCVRRRRPAGSQRSQINIEMRVTKRAVPVKKEKRRSNSTAKLAVDNELIVCGLQAIPVCVYVMNVLQVLQISIQHAAN